MILAGTVGVFVDPLDIEQIQNKQIPMLIELFENHKVIFVVSGEIESIISGKKNANALYEAYKIGMLKLFLECIFPEKKNSDYFKIIKKRFQVYASERKFQLRLTLFKKEQKMLFPNVLD